MKTVGAMFDNVANTRFVYDAIMHTCVFLYLIMIETCALHQERFITNICLPWVFQNMYQTNQHSLDFLS